MMRGGGGHEAKERAHPMRAAAAVALLAAAGAMTAGAASCGGDRGGARPDAAPALLDGFWRGALESPGGEIPFMIRFEGAGEALAATVINGEESVPVPTVTRGGATLTLGFDHYDSAIRATVSRDGARLEGEWSKVHHGGRVIRLPFRASRAAADTARFGPPDPPASAVVGDVTGEWEVVFHEPTRDFPARGVFHPSGGAPGDMMGTFVTPEGDYRYLAGDWRDGVLRLSGFDGAHAFRIVARARDDGTLEGHIWSRNTYDAPFTARRATSGADTAPLPDPYAMTSLTNDRGRLSFAFPSLDGAIVTSEDPRWKGRVLIVQVFGSWCPNCNDEAPLLVDLHRRYRDRGLEIVGLAFEMTGDPARDAVFVRRFAERHGIPWPLLIAGTSDKAEASKVLPDLSGILSFPTLIFVGRDGRVRAIHTGFSGPGTGARYDRTVEEFTARIEALLAEPA